MSSVINTNIPSLSAQRNLDASSRGLSTALQRLSSGLRINTAKDDAAGLAISERMSTQIRGQGVAQRNANDGISLAQTAESALQSASDMLQRMRELAIQSANATNSPGDRQALNAEVQQLTQELQRIATNTEFNGKKLLDGSFGSASFQVGANAHQTITATMDNLRTEVYGNYRIGGMAAASLQGTEDLTPGTTGSAGDAYGDGRLGFGSHDKSPMLGAAAGDLTISGRHGSRDVTYPPGSSAESIAQAINHADAGVRASALTEVIMGNVTTVNDGWFAQDSSYTLFISTDSDNSTSVSAPKSYETVSFTTGGGDPSQPLNSADQLQVAAQAFNEVATKTGFIAEVVQSDNGYYCLRLRNNEGKDLRLFNASEMSNSSGVSTHLSLFDVATDDSHPATLSALDQLGTVVGAVGWGVALSPWAGGGDWVAGWGAWISGRVVMNSESSFSVTAKNSDIMRKTLPIGTAETRGAQLQSVSEIDISTYGAVTRSLDIIDSALATINGARAKLGALQSRFESTISNLQASTENLSASRSRIRDADYAEETARLTRAQILQQAGSAMLAQANATPQQVLTLLQS